MYVFDDALRVIGKWEGGWSNHRRDPGGATKYGITIKTLATWRKCKVTIEDVKNLTYAEAKAIYRAWYWDKIRGDDLPPAIAFIALDCAINQGVSRAGKFIQQAHNKNTDKTSQLKVDGQIGPSTLGAVARIDPEILLRDFAAIRALHYSSLTQLLTSFGFGWFRRLFDVYRCSVKYLTTA